MHLSKNHVTVERVSDFWHDVCNRTGVLRDKGETKMKTKINLNADMNGLNQRETLVRDSKNLKVKTAIRAGAGIHFKYA